MALPKVGSIGEYIREQRKQAKISLRQLAQAAGVSNPYLSQIERGLRKPSAEILNQIAKALRISSQALYVQAGLIEDREPDSDVVTAIMSDRFLTERQRQVLIDIYESFRKENSGTSATGDAHTSQKTHPRPRPADDTVDESASAPSGEEALPDALVTALKPFTTRPESPGGNGATTKESKEG